MHEKVKHSLSPRLNKKSLNNQEGENQQSQNLTMLESLDDDNLLFQSPLATEEEVLVEVRKKVWKHLALTDSINEDENAIDFIIKKYIQVVNMWNDIGDIASIDKDILDKYIKVRSLELRALNMLREDVWLKKKQAINIKVMRNNSLSRWSLSI